jgi:hypothetical protein
LGTARARLPNSIICQRVILVAGAWRTPLCVLLSVACRRAGAHADRGRAGSLPRPAALPPRDSAQRGRARLVQGLHSAAGRVDDHRLGHVGRAHGDAATAAGGPHRAAYHSAALFRGPGGRTRLVHRCDAV